MQFIVVVVVSAITDMVAAGLFFNSVTRTTIGRFSVAYPSIEELYCVFTPCKLSGMCIHAIVMYLHPVIFPLPPAQNGDHQHNSEGEITIKCKTYT